MFRGGFAYPPGMFRFLQLKVQTRAPQPHSQELPVWLIGWTPVPFYGPSLLSRVERLHSQAGCFSDPIGGPEQGRNSTRERILGHQSLFAWLSGNYRVPQASFDLLVHLLSPPPHPN